MGVQLFVEFEVLGVRPDVRAVVVDEDGDVAEDTDVFASAVLAQAAPLLAEEVLNGLLDGELAAVAGQQRANSVVLALLVLDWPVDPADVSVHAAQHVEHCVVGEPGEIVLAEILEASQPLRRGMVEEVGRCLFNEWELEARGFFKVGGTVVPGQAGMRSSAIQPCLTRRSRLMKSGLPAKAESAE